MVCTMETLPVPVDTFRSDTAAIDPSGRFIVGSAIVRQATDTFPLLLWRRGQLTQIDPPMPDASPVDVNQDGVVIGNGRVNSQLRPWRYHAGVTTPLPVIDPADDVQAKGINARGDIVGIGRTPEGLAYVLLWPVARPGTVRVLNAPDNLSDVVGISDGNAVVGNAGGAIAPTSWLRTPEGSVRALRGPDGSSDALVTAVGGHWAVGQSFQASGLVGLRWDLRTRVATTLDPSLGPVPTDVNARGAVLAGMLVQRGSIVVTLPSPSPGEPIGGRAIADDGTVVGFHNNRLPGGVRAVRWTGC